ncbi:TetR/AcrR family transcriptional regulator [Streptococcus caprae]|uniref:TetR/AcrR family transcriptional regulator n=1 Tax=Streptococcus caprae TaxID=1640501 RepID=A0ABV8CWK2_9STRE
MAVASRSLENLARFNRENKQLTKESLETALLFCLEQKDLSQITISELVKKAGVSRNAFYRHYKSKEEILETIVTSVLRRIFRGITQFDLRSQVYQAWLYLFTEVKKEATILKLAFQNHLEKALTSIIAKRFKAYQRYHKRKHSSYATFFFSNAIVSVLSNWLADGMVVSAEEMASMELPLVPNL